MTLREWWLLALYGREEIFEIMLFSETAGRISK